MKKKWYYFYWAIDSEGNTMNFLLWATRDAKVAERCFRTALWAPHTALPRVIPVEKNAVVISM